MKPWEIWIAQRLKAVVAFAVPGIVTVFMKAIESGFGVDIPDTWESWILAAVTSVVAGIAVHQTPNKP